MKGISMGKTIGLAVCLLLLGVGMVLGVQRQWYFVLFLLVLLSVACVAALFRVQRRSEQRLLHVLEGIADHDLSATYVPLGHGRTERQLAELAENLVGQLRAAQTRQTADHQYYEALLDTVDALLLVWDAGGRISWMNKEAIRQLRGFRLHHLKELAVLNPDFPGFLQSLRPGVIQSIRLRQSHGTVELAATLTRYQASDRRLYLCCLRNVHPLLEQKEAESWQKLVSVLTHEMMNSLAPILSLSDTLCDRMEPRKDEDPRLWQGLSTIRRRSQGLLQFIENYRTLSRLPQPVCVSVRLYELLADLQKLYPQCVFDTQMADRVVEIDRGQMEQVLINLLKNAVEATAGMSDPHIRLQSMMVEGGRLQWRVEDNGPGILPEVADKVFVPFFTTKASGCGIGLSLCKQIVANHHGTITVRSTPGRGAVFVVELPLVRQSPLRVR